jgi:hypothetical protein
MNEIAQEHYQRYLHNAALAKRIETSLPDDRDWACVVLFYAAVHLMTAYLVMKHNVALDPSSAVHPERKKAMDRCPELKDSRDRYRQPKDLSESVRHDPGFVFGAQQLVNAKSYFGRIVGIVEPKVKRLLGVK